MMQSNLKIKRAVAVALGIFALGLQQQAVALGLGDLNVKSHLGQPFRAKIKVHGASDLIADDANKGACFKLGESDNGNALTAVSFKLDAVTGDEAMLTLSTAQVINEPILDLVVMAECGTSIRRDYVVLLDPILTAETENVADEETSPIAVTPMIEAKKPAKAHPQSVKTTDTIADESADKKPRHTKKSSKNKALNTNIVLHVPGGNVNAQTMTAEKTAEKNSPPANQPRLSISSSAPMDAPSNTANLRLDNSRLANLHLDRQLTFTPDANAEAPLADVDMQDEVTAMNNRLAHLTAQVAKLQSRNLALESDNKVKTQALSETETFKAKLRWIGYALGVALALVSASIAAKWWRRRAPKKIGAAAQWSIVENAESTDAQAAEDDSQNIDVRVKKSTGESTFIPSDLSFEDSIIVEDKNYDLSILDHADVFLSHGRTALAIQLLQNHLLDYPKQSVTIWLFLLDLLRKEKMQAVYEQTALECKEHFNIKIAEFAAGEIMPNQNLESFPLLTEGLQQVWGTSAAVIYLDDLIYNNRLEPRAGLDKSLIEELIMLKGIAQENVNSAQVIQLDEKKIAMLEQKEALIASKKAEKLQKMDEAFEQVEAKNKADEMLYEFKLADWK